MGRRRTRSSLRVLVIDGHPCCDNLGAWLAETIRRTAANRFEERRLIRLRELNSGPQEAIVTKE